MHSKLFFLILGTAFATPVWAINMFCPGNFNQVKTGDTLIQVETQCGKPTTQKTTKTSGVSTKIPQEWSYYLPVMPPNVGAVKLTLAIKDDQVILISINGISLQNTDNCGGQIIGIGDSAEKVQAVCGKPGLVNISAGTVQPPPDEITELYYGSDSQLGPTATFIFENGKLIQKK